MLHFDWLLSRPVKYFDASVAIAWPTIAALAKFCQLRMFGFSNDTMNDTFKDHFEWFVFKNVGDNTSSCKHVFTLDLCALDALHNTPASIARR